MICFKPRLSSLCLFPQSYDSNGTRRSITRDNLTLLALYDQEDRLLSYGDLIFEYNDHGDLRKKTNAVTSDTTTYTYNQLGQLTNVTLPDLRQITYSIDGEGKRQSKSVNGVVDTYFIYDLSGRLVAEFNPSGSLRSHFVYATQNHSPDLMIKYGVTYRLAKDHLGSIRAVVNTQTGEVAQQINYDEFGVVTEDTNPGYQPFGFAGGHYDPDTRLVRFGARDYDAEVGRWTSKDPILFRGGDGNLYGYAYNDPINTIDPSGLNAADDFFNRQIDITNRLLDDAFGNEKKGQIDAIKDFLTDTSENFQQFIDEATGQNRKNNDPNKSEHWLPKPRKRPELCQS